MNAGITKLQGIDWLRGWVLYDGDCPFCRRWTERFERTLTRRGFDFAPLQTPWVSECLGLTTPGRWEQMHVLTTDGRDFGGADALLFLARHIWWARPLCALAALPGGRRLLRRGYGWLAAHRPCRDGAGKVLRSAHL